MPQTIIITLRLPGDEISIFLLTGTVDIAMSTGQCTEKILLVFPSVVSWLVASGCRYYHKISTNSQVISREIGTDTQ
jgi:hypothetical protein